MEKLYGIPREKLSQISHKFTKVRIEFLGSTEEKTGDLRGGKTSRTQLHAHLGRKDKQNAAPCTQRPAWGQGGGEGQSHLHLALVTQERHLHPQGPAQTWKSSNPFAGCGETDSALGLFVFLKCLS